MRWPDFIYIGVSRAGSTWLYQVLSEHPGITMPRAKEIQFFDKNYERGAAWYGTFFAGIGAGQITGEVWHDYFIDPLVAARMNEHCPNIRLLVTLREPIDWTRSRLAWAREVEGVGALTLEAYLARPAVARELDYYRNLLPFYERFSPDRVLVQFYDDLRTDPAAFARNVYRFLGVASDVRVPSMDVRANPARRARFRAANRAALAGVRVLRAVGAAGVVGRLKQSAAVQRILFRDTQPESPAANERIQLRYAASFDDLERLIGRPVPASWRPSG